MRAQNDGLLAAYAEAVRGIARKSRISLADIYAEWERLADSGVSTDDWLCNGLNHPDRRGHAIMASVAFNSLVSRSSLHDR